MAEKEALLRLRLTAQNEANPAFESAAGVMKSLSSSMGEAVSKAESLMSSLNKVGESSRSMGTAVEGASKGFNSTSQSANEFERALTKMSEMSYRTREQLVADFDGIKKSFGNESLAAVEAAQLTDTQLKKIVETAQQTSIEVVKSMENMDKKMSETGNNTTLEKGSLMIGLQQLGQSMEDIGHKGDAMFKDAIKSAAEFEFNVSRIHAVLMNREPNANMEEMAQTALKLGSNSKFSANEIAQGMYDLARQGLSSTQILGDGVNGAIQIVNNLAQSTDTDMGETAKVITDVMHEFGLSGEQLGKVGDMISGTMHSSSISMNDFYYSMRQVGPVASNMHQSIDDVSTTIALLAQHGISGSAAGTALKNMLLGLEPRTKKAAELMKELGISAKNGAADSFYQLSGNLKPLPDIIGILHDKFGDLNDSQKQAALSATFTKYGLAGLNTIVSEGKDKFEELKKTLSEEKSADIAREKMNNLHGDMLRLNAAAETAKKSFGDTLAPAMRTVAQAAQGIVNWFASLSPTTKEVIMIVGGVASAMTLLGGIILSAVSTIGFLSMGLEGLGLTFGAILGPIGLVIGIVAVLGLAAYELIKHWDEVSTWMRKNLGVDIPQIWNSLKTTATTVFKAIGDVFSEVWNGIKQITQDVWDYIGPTITDGVKAVSDVWNDVWPKMKELFVEVWAAVKIALTPALIFLKFEIAAAVGFIQGAWHDAWNAIKDAFKLVWDLIIDILRLAWDVISGVFQVALDLLTGHWSDAWNGMKTLLSNLVNDFNKILGDFVVNAFNFGKDLVMSVANGITGAIGSVISAAKSVVSAITSIFSSAPTSPSVSSGNAIQQASDAVPQFAEGGKVTRPTLAMLGEGGEPEYIIPESKLRSQGGYTLGLSGGIPMPGGVPSGGNRNGGGNVQMRDIVINVNGAGKDGKQIGSDVMSILRREFKFAL